MDCPTRMQPTSESIRPNKRLQPTRPQRIYAARWSVNAASQLKRKPLGGLKADRQPRRVLQLSTSRSLKRAKSLTLTVTRTRLLANAIAAICPST